MARWQYGADYKRRATKQLSFKNQERARRYLDMLARNPVPGVLKLKPMEGWKRELWECHAGGQNRFILRLAKDEIGVYFIVEDVGPHDIYKQYRP
jgi:hypothetical protein